MNYELSMICLPSPEPVLKQLLTKFWAFCCNH